LQSKSIAAAERLGLRFQLTINGQQL